MVVDNHYLEFSILPFTDICTLGILSPNQVHQTVANLHSTSRWGYIDQTLNRDNWILTERWFIRTMSSSQILPMDQKLRSNVHLRSRSAGGQNTSGLPNQKQCVISDTGQQGISSQIGQIASVSCGAAKFCRLVNEVGWQLASLIIISLPPHNAG